MAIQGILSTYAAQGNREDLAPKRKATKRKKVAYKWQGREKSSNVVDRRNEKSDDALMAEILTSMADEKASRMDSTIPTDQDLAPRPLPRPKKAPIPKKRPKGL